MNIQLEKVSEQIKNFTETLTYNGLNFVNPESIREIEFFLQHTSQLKLFRLATSLRYLHVELMRFLDNNPAFNIERYIFFLSNCWLQSRAFIAYAQTKKNDIDFYNNLKGATSETKIINKLILQLIGVEKVILEGVMMGFVFYFLSIFGKTRSSVLKWNLMSPYQEGINPEFFLQRSLPNSEPPSIIGKILSNFIELENIPCAIKEKNIFLEKNPESKVFIGETSDDIFSILKLRKFYLNSNDIYKKLTKDYEVTPFDLPTNSLDYLYVKDVDITSTYLEEDDKIRIPVHVFTINHEKEYPLSIRLPKKTGNQNLIKVFNAIVKKKNLIDGLFCKLIIERGQLGLFPISIVKNNKLEFPTISEVHSLDNREFLKKVYKIK
ncbi:MAG: hypothetical protein ACFFBT_02830 [Promethearchaeota archaeon]